MPTPILTPKPSPMRTQMSTPMLMYLLTTTILEYYAQSGYATSYGYSSMVLQTPTASLFFQGDSSSQPPYLLVEWRKHDGRLARAKSREAAPPLEARMTLHSTMEEGDEDEDEDRGGDEDKDEGRDVDEDEGRDKD
ncbi:hypothetical protein J1N35_001273 [Gossypium stocksii]|uniref:Uncharacterized protein n=1 Tax=Gossypium stocksii TaxID=47602 RepID=A0A9D3WIS3_9ROSI|nr:hypothetical protein J1N35_001273 [Gossypium stocksii]